MEGRYLISVSGPTAIGKTDWAIRLARHYNTSILSADSRQFYREMRIGTAVPSIAELEQAPHFFIQHRSISEPYSVGDFQREALQKLRELFATRNAVIMVGGSGLYLDAVTGGLDEFPEVPAEVRENLQDLLKREGIAALQQLLQEHDPKYFGIVDTQNPRRLIRALEVCLASGQPYSSFRGKKAAPDFFTHLPLGIQAPREIVYRRIDQRVDLMMAAGLLEEAERLYPSRDLTALQTVGYQELFAYLEGRWDLATAVAEIKKNTRRFARRQGTWLRKHPEIHWVPYDAPTREATDYLDIRMKAPNHG
ncbi:tRNA (adenosine(37)-N6)-dimethylallyltransferase MiaA [Robiginitalea marina]|uniref:tRNA dimethylallyltransferase n=1 Tax=Robiginitalea marina TaxID=2954105 RepID=A0ABT1AUK6_9FLAO|nr:tRNA (adenosine(37)-N6)-dimethylallyltransferase MiaA [Robiginitalea marina]MCO5723724.1 tRNA (adenosine(37)-N6)-dimethylallyltransferase MiaA [Robiginitalea marina]